MNITFALYFNFKLMKGAEEGSKASFLKDSAAVHYKNGRYENSCMGSETRRVAMEKKSMIWVSEMSL